MGSVLATSIHSLAAVIWVGGMFFAYQVLRPAAMVLEPPQRLTLWGEVFGRFFKWVWAIVILTPLTGYYRLYTDMGGFSEAAIHIHIMHMTGLLMIIIYLYLYFVPYREFKTAVNAQTWPQAGAQIGKIRWLILINLILGLITVVVGVSVTYWPLLS